MTHAPSLYIDGQWCHAGAGAVRDVLDPARGAAFDVVDEAGPADARAAIAAARRAFDTGPWPSTPVAERAEVLTGIAALLQRDREALAEIETRDTGKTLAESRIDIDDVTAVFRYYADLVGGHADRLVDVGNRAVISRVIGEPVGVCVLIAPWNYPLLQMSWKVAPALAAGATMVAKPSEVTPLSTVALVRLAVEAGVPPGVLNLLTGSGADLGEALLDTDDVDLVSFTGGLATGRVVAGYAARHVMRCTVELGGKNPHVVFADADWDSSVDQVLTGAFLHSGQVCSAGTRLIVEESIAEEFVADLAVRVAKIRLGDGMDPTSQVGPLVSEQHRRKVEDYVSLGLSEGARLVCGGARPADPALAAGSFYLPTIFDRCHRGMRVVAEETFGPILTVERFGSEAEAVALANDTAYGLAAGVRTGDAARGERVARALRHGTVWLNDFGQYTPAAEWGGFGKSGNGRELGPTGLAEYQELKHIWHNTAPAPSDWFTT